MIYIYVRVRAIPTMTSIKKIIKLKKQVGMAVQKSTHVQTKSSRENNRQGAPYILFSSNMKTEVRDAPCLLFSLLLLFVHVYFFAPPSLLASSI